MRSGLQGFHASHGVKDHVGRYGIGDVGHVRPSCRLAQRRRKGFAVEGNAKLCQPHRRAQRDEECAKLARFFLLPVQHELHQRTVGDQIAVQELRLHVREQL